MKRILLPALCLISTCLLAQSTTHEKFSLAWTSGQIVFKSGDTLNCDLRFNQTGGHHILQVNEGGELITLPIRDVKSFRFFDAVKNRERRFAALQNPLHEDHEYYMEQIYADRQFSILNQKTLEVPEELSFSRFIGKPVKTYKKYIRHEPSGTILPLNRESLLRLLASNRTKVLSFVKDRGIRFRRISDFIQVFEYHNSL